MADTQRSRAAILALSADNVTGQIGAQDVRDFIVSVMNAEFAYVGDFWAEPAAAQLTSEGGRGWKIYSQVVDSAVSFAGQVYLTASGTWKNANTAASGANCLVAVALSNITSGDSGILLRNGLIFCSAYSATFSGLKGRPVYLASGAIGSITITAPSYPKVVGVIEDDTNGIFRFNPNWSVVGV